MRRVCLIVCLALLGGACGGGETSLTQYADELNAMASNASQQWLALVSTPRGAVLVAEPSELEEFTPQDLQAALQRVEAIEIEAMEALADLEPPAQVAEVHEIFFSPEFTEIEAALAVRAGTATSWEELSETEEMAAYREALAADKQLCFDLQAQLDATGERRELAETPWIPEEMKEVVSALLRCDGYPEHPENVFRPPTTTGP